MMKFLKRALLAAAALYLLFCSVLYFGQERIIFHPDKLPEDYIFRAGEEVEIGVADGVSLNCLCLNEPESKGVVLYLHGNKGSNRRCLHLAQTLEGNGSHIFMPDYPVFGISDGTI